MYFSYITQPPTCVNLGCVDKAFAAGVNRENNANLGCVDKAFAAGVNRENESLSCPKWDQGD